jgi:hypothetical protein
MKEEILAHLKDPGQLERMYRTNRGSFKREFNTLYPGVKGNILADFWNERLNYENDEIRWGTRIELTFVIIASILAGIIAKLPAILPISEDFFYPRNLGFIVFPALMAYFVWKNNLSISKIAFIVTSTLIGSIFINSLPGAGNGDTLILSSIHLLIFLWFVLGFAYVGDKKNIVEKRLDFLKYNGDLVVITTLILITGGIMSGLTIGLFSLIGFNIEEFYFRNVVVFLAPAAPILGTYLIKTNPQLVGKVSPVIAKIFSPLVFVMLVIYLVALIYSGKDPYNDREFLLIFNALLIGVMAIIFFSVAEPKVTKSKMETWILFLLSGVTVVVNSIALSAIVFRISEFGVTPNRIAILGANILILVNLLLVTAQLFRVVSKKAELTGVGKVIAFYLPVYFIWAAIVTFLFPFIFRFQ